MRSELARTIETDATVQDPPTLEPSQGYGPLAVLTLFAAALFCYLLV